ncbi:uncharacterized protein PRCAT00005558001 [Priceomyces carsonii]|uniref:uncharacterized protein n=1 Tax=Priceomyces carsonii TaxID=28549 RepID=UPI002EDB7D51|nr:unnamed protein product [Priceomyces carsonii]
MDRSTKAAEEQLVNGADSLVSPLSRIRLTKAPSAMAGARDDNSNSEKVKWSSETVKEGDEKLSGEQSELNHSPTKDGFNVDRDISQPRELGETIDIDDTDIKKAGNLTSILLDTRKVLRADCNVVEPMKNNNGEGIWKDKDVLASKFSPSRSTLTRAERIKSMIALKYLYIQRIYDWNEQNKYSNEHPGVDGVYNPLQIIRNRKIRKKYHEYPKPLSISTIPLASNVFSSHNGKNNKKPWKCIWAIELNELLSDLSWRSFHWHELKNAKGNLWFPSSSGSSDIASKSKSKERLHKLHDKLFSEEDITSRRLSSNHLSTTSTDEEYKAQSSKRSKASDKKNKSRSSKKSHSDFSSPSQDESDDTKEGKQSSKERTFKGDIPLALEELNTSTEGNLTENNEPEAPPLIKIDDASERDINSVSIRPLEKRPGEEVASKEKEILKPHVSVDPNDDEVVQLERELTFLAKILDLKISYMVTLYPQLMESTNLKINNIIEKKINQIMKQSAFINDECLPAYEELYSTLLDEVKSILHLANDNYAVKIDSLLSKSDRSIGEINTSLSLDLRKFSERLDKLNSSLFRNIVSDTLRDNDLTMKLNEGDKHAILYYILENLIVVMLRIVWIVVTFYKIILYILMVFWRIIKLIFST